MSKWKIIRVAMSPALLSSLFFPTLKVLLRAVQIAPIRNPAGLAAAGILEILPLVLFSLGLNDIIHFIPLAFLAIIFTVGCITFVGGVIIFFLPKPPLKENV